MKKTVLSLVLLMTSLIGYADNEAYLQAMKSNIELLNKAGNIDDYLKAANKFERIANAEIDKWLPYYYASYAYVLMSFSLTEGEKIDLYLDQAEELLTKAIELEKKESELFVLKGMLFQARISVDPQSRGMSYGMKANTALEKAKKLNPENPRIYFILGQSLFHTPKMYGGGKEVALPLFKTAEEKFKSFTPETEISPDWGKEINLQMIEACGKDN